MVSFYFIGFLNKSQDIPKLMFPQQRQCLPQMKKKK